VVRIKAETQRRKGLIAFPITDFGLGPESVTGWLRVVTESGLGLESVMWGLPKVAQGWEWQVVVVEESSLRSLFMGRGR